MMAIGERIRFFRNLRGMTQKYLGTVVGFPEKTADIRMAQYESGTRTPKADLTNKLAEVFGISPDALNVPDIDSYIGLMHTLFTLEDIYGLTIEKRDGEIIMRIDPFNSREARNLFELIHKRRKKSSTIFCSQFEEKDWYSQICNGENTLADAIMDRISYDSYKINIEYIDKTKDRSMREVYGLDPAMSE